MLRLYFYVQSVTHLILLVSKSCKNGNGWKTWFFTGQHCQVIKWGYKPTFQKFTSKRLVISRKTSTTQVKGCIISFRRFISNHILKPHFVIKTPKKNSIYNWTFLCFCFHDFVNQHTTKKKWTLGKNNLINFIKDSKLLMWQSVIKSSGIASFCY